MKMSNNILNRFSSDFEENVRLNPLYNQVYYMLLNGIDEYVVIEELLKLVKNNQNEIIRITEEKNYPKYIAKSEKFIK